MPNPTYSKLSKEAREREKEQNKDFVVHEDPPTEQHAVRFYRIAQEKLDAGGIHTKEWKEKEDPWTCHVSFHHKTVEDTYVFCSYKFQSGKDFDAQLDELHGLSSDAFTQAPGVSCL